MLLCCGTCLEASRSWLYFIKDADNKTKDDHHFSTNFRFDYILMMTFFADFTSLFLKVTS